MYTFYNDGFHFSGVNDAQEFDCWVVFVCLFVCLLRNCRAISQNGCKHFQFPPATHERCSFPMSSPVLCTPTISQCNCSNRYAVRSHPMILILTPLTSGDGEHLPCSQMPSLIECVFTSFVHFMIELFAFFSRLSFKSFLDILNMSPSSAMCFANIFS